MGGLTAPGERLWLTSGKDRLVPDGDPDAAILYCTEHDEVDEGEYQALTGVKQRKTRGSTKELKADVDDKAVEPIVDPDEEIDLTADAKPASRRKG